MQCARQAGRLTCYDHARAHGLPRLQQLRGVCCHGAAVRPVHVLGAHGHPGGPLARHHVAVCCQLAHLLVATAQHGGNTCMVELG